MLRAAELGYQNFECIAAYTLSLHWALLAMIYNEHVSLYAITFPYEDIQAQKAPLVLKGSQSLAEGGRLSFGHRRRILSLLGLARYYGALPAIRAIMQNLLLSYPNFWRTVAGGPEYFITMATQLEWKELYFDIKRHLLAGDNSIGSCRRDTHQSLPAQALGLTNSEYLDCKAVHRRRLARVVRKLERDLLRLQLTTVRWYNDGQVDDDHVEDERHSYVRRDMASCVPKTGLVPTTFLHAFQLQAPGPGDHIKRKETVEYVARSIFGDWLTNHIVGGYDLEIWRASVAAHDAVSFRAMCNQIRISSAEKQPSSMFTDEDLERLCAVFHFEQNYATDMRRTLDDLVRQANVIIEHAFRTKTVKRSCGTVLTYRRANCDEEIEEYDNFTWMGLDETVVPWAAISKDACSGTAKVG